MPKPNDFTLNSDFASFAADSSENTISITISSGSTVPTSSPYWQSFAPGGSMQSFLRSRMHCSKDGKWGAGTKLELVDHCIMYNGANVNPWLSVCGVRKFELFRVKDPEELPIIWSMG